MIILWRLLGTILLGICVVLVFGAGETFGITNNNLLATLAVILFVVIVFRITRK